MTTYQILCLFGIPSLLTAAVTHIIVVLKTQTSKTKALMKATQALLRDRLYAEYEKAKNLGGKTTDEAENFENMYEQYHSLGTNGVMDSIREKYMALPII